MKKCGMMARMVLFVSARSASAWPWSKKADAKAIEDAVSGAVAE